MNIRLVKLQEESKEGKIIKCNKLTNDMIFMKYDVLVGNEIIINEDEYVVLIWKGEVFDAKSDPGYYKIMNEIIDNNEDIKEEWKDLHIRKTENDDLCIVFLNKNEIVHNKYTINDPIEYIDYTKQNLKVHIKLEGFYNFKVENPKELLSKVIGLRKYFSKQELIEKIRKYVLKSITEGINELANEYKLDINELPENSKKLEIKLKQNEYDKKLLEYGVKLTYFDIDKLEIVNKKFKIF